MKSKLSVTSTFSSSIKYPVLAISKPNAKWDGEYVVLFESERKGTVVNVSEKGVAPWKLGHTAYDWVEVSDEEYWRILPVGTSVILTQTDPT
jgi:hypothetical protein